MRVRRFVGLHLSFHLRQKCSWGNDLINPYGLVNVQKKILRIFPCKFTEICEQYLIYNENLFGPIFRYYDAEMVLESL